ncbi:pVII [turkey adenovirus 5]|uniref:PVII n=1 Tax=turkey adenovirus 5 TaxID=1408258 RepID=U5NEL8_9ADEN|nr:pVII [Turkey aviadenovirus 5]AGX93338.1 pVII [Turkey aviadenovirus 5]AGX93375.1 pVII [Turkey aviadenovirus 5]
MSVLISPSDNRGWGAGMRYRRRTSMRGVGRRRMTLRQLLGLGARRRRRTRPTTVSNRLVVVSTRRRSSRRRR